jgi:pimeloyl-ACP methyl ester carboxylesterase
MTADGRDRGPWVDCRVTTGDGIGLHCRDYAGLPGAGARPPVLCLPGLTRNCRDFEPLALHLADRHRVLTPDLRGRGRSDHDPDWRRYRLDVYVADMLTLLDALGVARVVVVGTSLGGLIGMFLAAGHRARVAGLVLNDIGPELDPRGMLRIATGVGTARAVATWAEAAADARAANEIALPDLVEAAWLRFAQAVYREEAPGRIVRDMDPMIGRALREPTVPTPDFWAAFASLDGLPMLSIRGELTDLLSEETFARMLARHPDMQSCRVPRRGHAPTLDEPESRAALDRFLAPWRAP